MTKYENEKFAFTRDIIFLMNEQCSLRNDFYAINSSGIDSKEGKPVAVYIMVQENCSQERRALVSVIWQQIIREKEIAIVRAR